MVAEIAAIVLSWRLEPVYDTLLYAVFSIASVGAGALIAQRHPGNPIGWLFCGFGLLNALTADLAQGWGLRAAAEGWAAGTFAEWIVTMSWLVSGFGWTLTFLLFPTGRLPGPNWRPLPWIGVVGLVLSTVGWSLSPDRGQDFVGGRNPWAVESLPTGVLVAFGLPLFLGSLMAAVVSLAVRFRRSRGVERQQLKWFVLAASIAGVVLPTVFPLWYVTPAAGVLAALALCGLPLAAAAAILRYRLYDIDLFISRTVAYATLTVSLGAAYVVLIVALGTLFGRGSAWATAAATVVCAILFRPLRGPDPGRGRPAVQPVPVRRPAPDGRLPRRRPVRSAPTRGRADASSARSSATLVWSSSSSCRRANGTSTSRATPGQTRTGTGSRSNVVTSRSASSCTTARPGSAPSCSGAWSRTAGWRSRSPGCARNCGCN